MHQKKYVEYILKRFNMSNCNLIISPLEIGAKISKNIDELYKQVIGSRGIFVTLDLICTTIL